MPAMDKIDQKMQRLVAERERLVKIVNMRAQGSTLQQIGDEFKLTRERVRQILLQLATGKAVDSQPKRRILKTETPEGEAPPSASKSCVVTGERKT